MKRCERCGRMLEDQRDQLCAECRQSDGRAIGIAAFTDENLRIESERLTRQLQETPGIWGSHFPKADGEKYLRAVNAEIEKRKVTR